MRTAPVDKCIEVIRKARKSVGIKSDRDLCETTGISKTTWQHKRVGLGKSASMRGYELGAIVRCTGMSDEDIVQIVRSWT